MSHEGFSGLGYENRPWLSKTVANLYKSDNVMLTFLIQRGAGLQHAQLCFALVSNVRQVQQ